MQAEINGLLKSAGVRPTRQRSDLASILFGETARHLTAEMLYEEAVQADMKVSLATVYNTLNQLYHAGLLRKVNVDGAKIYFDTNVRQHHHFYIEATRELVDIPVLESPAVKANAIPEGFEILRVEIIIRLRKKSCDNGTID